MSSSKKCILSISLLFVALLLVSTSGPAQSDESTNIESSPWFDNLLTFIDSFAKIIGETLNSAISQVTGKKLPNLSKPMGYLGVFTISLAAFGALQVARKFIWLIVTVGWGLIGVRIAMELLNTGGPVK